MVDNIIASENPSNHLYIMYDIACSLHRHLLVRVYASLSNGSEPFLYTIRHLKEQMFLKELIFVFPLSILMVIKCLVRLVPEVKHGDYFIMVWCID